MVYERSTKSLNGQINKLFEQIGKQFWTDADFFRMDR